METWKQCNHFGLIWGLQFNQPGLERSFVADAAGPHPDRLGLLPQALCESEWPHHLQKLFPKQLQETSPFKLFLLQSSRSLLSPLRWMQCTCLSSLHLCCSLYTAGFTQFARRAVPSLTASSLVRAGGKKLMEAAHSCFSCRENWERLYSLPGPHLLQGPGNPSFIPQLQTLLPVS